MRSLLVVPLLALFACSEVALGPEPGPERETFSVSLGVWDSSDDVFSELVEEQPVDLVMGFQGLVFVNLALFADGDIPARYTAEGEVVFEDADERVPFFDGQVLFERFGDDARLVPSLRLAFDLPASELDGRTARFNVTLRSHDDEWEAHASGTFEIHDRACEHLPSGEIVCD